MTEEQFVSVDVVAEFLSMERKEVLRLTREKKITGYPVSGKLRKSYRYRLSEVAKDIAGLRRPSKIDDSSPSDSKPEKKNG
jgi:hypothetical protein